MWKLGGRAAEIKQKMWDWPGRDREGLIPPGDLNGNSHKFKRCCGRRTDVYSEDTKANVEMTAEEGKAKRELQA